MSSDSRGLGSGFRAFACFIILVAGGLGVSIAPAAAQVERVNSMVSVQVLRAASFAVEDVVNDQDDEAAQINIRVDIDDTAASVVIDNGVITTRLATMMGRAHPLRLRFDNETPSAIVQIMY